MKRHPARIQARLASIPSEPGQVKKPAERPGDDGFHPGDICGPREKERENSRGKHSTLSEPSPAQRKSLANKSRLRVCSQASRKEWRLSRKRTKLFGRDRSGRVRIRAARRANDRSDGRVFPIFVDASKDKRRSSTSA